MINMPIFFSIPSSDVSNALYSCEPISAIKRNPLGFANRIDAPSSMVNPLVSVAMASFAETVKTVVAAPQNKNIAAERTETNKFLILFFIFIPPFS